MDYKDLDFLVALNNQERSLEEIQEQIDRARKKYFDVNEIQLRLDRRQAELDKVKKRVMSSKGEVINPN